MFTRGIFGLLFIFWVSYKRICIFTFELFKLWCKVQYIQQTTQFTLFNQKVPPVDKTCRVILAVEMNVLWLWPLTQEAQKHLYVRRCHWIIIYHKQAVGKPAGFTVLQRDMAIMSLFTLWQKGEMKAWAEMVKYRKAIVFCQHHNLSIETLLCISTHSLDNHYFLCLMRQK